MRLTSMALAPIVALTAYACSTPYGAAENEARSTEDAGSTTLPNEPAPDGSGTNEAPPPTGDAGARVDAGTDQDAALDRSDYAFWVALCQATCQNISTTKCTYTTFQSLGPCVAACLKTYPTVPRPSCAVEVEAYLRCCQAKDLRVLCTLPGNVDFTDCREDAICEDEYRAIQCL